MRTDSVHNGVSRVEVMDGDGWKFFAHFIEYEEALKMYNEEYCRKRRGIFAIVHNTKERKFELKHFSDVTLGDVNNGAMFVALYEKDKLGYRFATGHYVKA